MPKLTTINTGSGKVMVTTENVGAVTKPAKPVTARTKEQWIKWLEGQLDTTSNAKYTERGNNRVFLTEEDDIDIARHILSTFLATVKKL